MSDRLQALRVRTADGGTALAAPRVGRFDPALQIGQLVDAQTQIGTLRVLANRYPVFAPAGDAGRVSALPVRIAGAPVGYGEPLVELESADMAGAEAATAAATGLAEGQWAVEAQMDGQFYTRPSPDEPEYAAIGQTIEPGATIGLIEVMKFFYPIVFDGDRAVRVVAKPAAHAAPVVAGDPLIIVEG